MARTPQAPLISIGMSVRNAERTLAEALQSILWQSCTDWELLVADDGSSDGSRAILEAVRDPRVRVFTGREQRGLAARLNELVASAQGPYFARMDADDIAFPERLARQLAYLQAHPEVDLAGCGALVIGRDGEAFASIPVRETHEALCARPWAGFMLAHPTWFGRTAWFRAHPYRAEWRLAQDQELLLRSFDDSRFACVPEALLGYRFEARRLAKRLASRYWLSRAVWREARRRGQTAAALRGVLAQGAKGALDCLQSAAGLDDWAMKKRLAPLPELARIEWRALHARLQHGSHTALQPEGL